MMRDVTHILRINWQHTTVINNRFLMDAYIEYQQEYREI